MRWCYLGRTEYRAGLALQASLRDAVRRGEPDTLILLEHPPVITLGRAARRENVLVPPEELRRRGVELVQVQRGGDVTYHGPGQLVGYPVRRVGRAVKAHVEGMVDALVTCVKRLGIDAWWDEAHPGVWTRGGKIAAVGVDARTGVATHGFALNVDPDLSAYRLIVPCGLAAPVTSIRALTGQAPALEDIARELAGDLAARYDDQATEIDPARVRAPGAAGAPGVALTE